MFASEKERIWKSLTCLIDKARNKGGRMILLLIALINLLIVSFGNDGFIKDGQAYMTAIFIECLFEIPIGCCIGCYLDNRH